MNPILVSMLLFLGGAVGSLLFIRRSSCSRWISLSLAILGSGTLLFQSIHSLFSHEICELILSGPKLIAGFHFYLTPLSALFTILISGLSLVVSLYALDYSKEYKESAALLGFFYNLFLLGMCLVPAAQNVFTFLFCWEGMTLASFFLVALEHEKHQSRKAATIYLVMSHIGTAFIFALFFILYQKTGSLEFAAFRELGPQLEANQKNILFFLILIGFGTKAGIVPLHLWLPYAHPAAPSHVSSLMSGVMIKTAIYGILLTTLSFLGGGFWWWGGIILVIAAISSLFGILYALMEQDIKRLLAYSSVENVGIILMGVGAGLLFNAFNHPKLAILAISAGLYHTVNHAVFKGLLFLSAGSVIKSMHTRNMEEMGGLIKTMPRTALFFLVGSISISALPPFNGFVSEWLIFQSLLSGLKLPSLTANLLCLSVSAALALTGGLAAACFVKAFGIPFLAQPRSENARNCKDAPFFEVLPMAILSLACLVMGIFPTRILAIINPVVGTLITAKDTVLVVPESNFLSQGYGAISPIVIGILLAFGFGVAIFIPRLFFGRKKVRVEPTWGCGFREFTPRMEYTATAFSKPFRMLFAFFYKPVREVRQECVESPYFPTSIRYSNEITHIIQKKLYHPPLKIMLEVSHFIRRLQGGSLNLYLGYLLATIVTLFVLFVWKA